MTTKLPLLVRAARGEAVERPPVWAMRQAGRWDPEFNRVRAGLSFYEFSENVELAAKASLLPRRFGVDGIILFYDITTLPVAMGQPFVLKPAVGPVPDFAVRTARRRRPARRAARSRSASGTFAICCAGEGGTARRIAGAGLRRRAVHRGDVLHRHRQGHGRDAPFRRRAAARLDRPARQADDGDGPFLARRSSARVPTSISSSTRGPAC